MDDTCPRLIAVWLFFSYSRKQVLILHTILFHICSFSVLTDCLRFFMHELLVVLFNHYLFGIFTFCILIDGLCWPFSLYMTNLCYIICKKHAPWNSLLEILGAIQLCLGTQMSLCTWFSHSLLILNVKIIGTIESWILL